MKTFKISLVLEADLEDEKQAVDLVQALIEGTYPPEREVDGGIAASKIEAEEVKQSTDHREEIFKLVQTTLDFCGNAFSAVKEYCLENDLRWQDFEDTRFKAIEDYYKKTEVKK